MRGTILKTAVAAGFLAAFAGSASAATEIQWWHAMTGANNDVVETLAKQFNDSQSDYKVVPVFKGSYDETLQAGIAAFRAHQPPHILQVFDVGTGVMMNAEGAIIPVADVLEKGGYKFDKSEYLPGIVAYYSKPDGTMLSFPYNSSSPITYYNKDILAKAGIDHNQSADDVAGNLGRRTQDQGERSGPVRVHHGVAHVDPSREFRGVEQSPVRHQRERSRRL